MASKILWLRINAVCKGTQIITRLAGNKNKQNMKFLRLENSSVKCIRNAMFGCNEEG